MLPWTAPFIVPTLDDEKIKQKTGEMIGANNGLPQPKHFPPMPAVQPPRASTGLLIYSANGKVEASIDGFDLGKTCSSLSLEMGPGGQATLSVDLYVTKNDIAIEGAVLKICSMEAGEKVERAVLDFLMAKYDVKPMNGKCTINVNVEPSAARDLGYQAGPQIKGEVTGPTQFVKFGPSFELQKRSGSLLDDWFKKV